MVSNQKPQALSFGFSFLLKRLRLRLRPWQAIKPGPLPAH
jgi:hypothetical protein